jgi:uncharacterized protein (TIRG00374 family)
MTDQPPEQGVTRRPPLWRRLISEHPVRRGALVVLIALVIEYLVLPQIGGVSHSLHLLRTVRPAWAIAGVVFEALSLVSYSLFTRTVLPSNRPPFSYLFRTDITALGFSHLLPGGTATATALRYRLLREGGVPVEDAAVGMAVQGVGSNLVLAAIAWLALVASIPFVGLHSLYAVAATIGGILIAATALTIFLRSRQRSPAPSGEVVRRIIQRLPLRVRPRIEAAARAAAGQLRRLLADKRSLRDSASWSVGNWGLDAASLWLFVAAYGRIVNPVGLLVAYGIANLIAIVPISPGGLGIIEAVVIPSLVGFGTPQDVAVLAVISWRLFNFWAPIPAAGGCYLSLRTRRWLNRHLR